MQVPEAMEIVYVEQEAPAAEQSVLQTVLATDGYRVGLEEELVSVATGGHSLAAGGGGGDCNCNAAAAVLYCSAAAVLYCNAAAVLYCTMWQ